MDNVDDNANEFPDGSIIKIEFRDFLTYENASLTAGRNLNLIIGVNGSGKSTVICGICLAVGGSPKNLGRSESLGDFVRHGKDVATVEVTISDKGKGPQRFKTIISRSKSTADYYLNNIRTTNKTIRDLATAYNIQIDNPCTFLAQDKVKSFAEQNPVKILWNTIKAGDPKLILAQEELVKKRQANKDLLRDKSNTDDRLAVVKAEIDTLEPRVQNYYKQRQQDSKINVLTQKQKIMEFDEHNGSYKTKLSACKRIQTKLDKQKKEEDELESQAKELDQMNKELSDECAETRRKYNMLIADIRGQARGDAYERLLGLQKKEFDEARKRFDAYELSLKATRDRQRDLERTLEKAKRDISECQHDSMFLTTERHRLIQDKNMLEDKINVEKGNLNKIRNDIRHLQYSFNNRSPYEDKLKILNGDRLPSECGYALQAWQFLESNDTGINVNVPFFDLVIRKENAKYIEGLVAPRDMMMFIFQNKEDELRLSQRFPKINTTVMNQNEVRSSNINVRIPSKLQELGFDCFAVELLQGPDVVLNYLCQVNGLNRIPVGRRSLDRYDETSRVLVDSFQINRFITGNQITNLKVSKYSGEMISNNRPLFPARLLVAHEKAVDMGNGVEAQKRRLAEMENEVIRRVNELDGRRNDAQARKNDIENKLCELKKLKEKEAVLSAQLDVVKKKLLNDENNKPDLDRAKAEYQKQKQVTAQKTLETAKEIIKQLGVLHKYAANINVMNTMMEDTFEKLCQVRGECDQKKMTTRELDAKCKEEEHDLNWLKNKVTSLSEELREVCNIPTTDEAKLNATQKAAWEKIKERFEQHDLVEKSKDEIETMLAQEQAQKKMRAHDGKLQDVEKHKELKLEQERLQKVAAEQATSLQTSTVALQKEIEEWQVPVEQLIAAINVNYSKYFQELGCVGEIFLDKPTDELDIANYGIHINVSFRANERPKRLDHQVQSGGERSVATMLYLLALQELCPVPFRCVDEINQGMDPTNERKVFDIMVKKLTGCGNLAKTQYFLLTPKLLHGLTYNDKVTVQCVHNSRALYPTANQWNPRDFLEKMRSA